MSQNQPDALSEEPEPPKPRTGRKRRALRRSSVILFEIVAAALAIIGLGIGLLAWRLSEGPIPLEMVEQQIEDQLTAARAGRKVEVDGAALVWRNSAHGLEIVADRVRVYDAAGLEQTATRQVDIGIDLASLLTGRFAISRLAFEGGAVTIRLAADGSASLAFGGPTAAPDLVIPAPAQTRTLIEQVNWVLDGLSAAMKPLGPGGQLRKVQATGLALIIQDEAGGELWKATDAALEGARSGASIRLTASASFNGPRGPAPASVAITTEEGFSAALVELIARDVRLNALVPPQVLGPLEKFVAPVTAAVTVGVDRRQGVTRIEGDVTLGRGEVNVAGGKLALEGASISGRYDLKSDILVIDDVQLAGARTRVEGEMRFRNASAFLGASDERVSQFDLALSRLELDVPGFLGEPPVPLTDVSAKGRLLITENAIEVEQATAYLDGAPARAVGRFGLGDDGKGVIRPSVKLDASLEGEADVRKILAFWPKPLDPEARAWTELRVETGRVRDARARLDLRPQDLRGQPIPRERIDVTFGFSGARVRYLDGMSPVENGAGEAHVEGDRFDLALNSALLNGLAVSRGRVFLPGGALQRREPAVYALTAAGDLRAAVDVLRQAPLGVDAALPFDPASLAGTGALSVSISALRPNPATEDRVIRFDVNGQFKGVGGVFKQGGARLTDATVAISGDERALTFSGPAALGASRAEVVWTENLRQGAAPRSRFAIAGRFDAKELDVLGFGLGDAVAGPIQLEVRGQGEGTAFSAAGVRMDLRQASLRLPGGVWAKPAGTEATLAFEARRASDGAMSINDLDLRGAGGVFAAGEAEFGPDKVLRKARISRFAMGPRTQIALTATRNPAGVLEVAAQGAAFDIAPWLGEPSATPPPPPTQAAPAAPTAGPAERIALTLNVDRAHMRGGATLAKAKLRLVAHGDAVNRLTIDGATPDGEDFNLSLGDGEGEGPLAFSTADAGFAVRALTGADNVYGGRADAVGAWRPGAPGRAEFTLTASDFKVRQLGAFAELLSSVSSLTGLVDTLNGEGIGFKALEAPMVFDQGKLTVRDARANGDSLGITMKGDLELARGRVALDGVVAPAYGINAMFTDVPVLGTLLTSRPGEGVVGITYTVAGAPDALKVGVNPLSALAPGIFRRIFEPIAPREAQPRRRPRRQAQGG